MDAISSSEYRSNDQRSCVIVVEKINKYTINAAVELLQRIIQPLHKVRRWCDRCVVDLGWRGHFR